MTFGERSTLLLADKFLSGLLMPCKCTFGTAAAHRKWFPTVQASDAQQKQCCPTLKEPSKEASTISMDTNWRLVKPANKRALIPWWCTDVTRITSSHYSTIARTVRVASQFTKLPSCLFQTFRRDDGKTSAISDPMSVRCKYWPLSSTYLLFQQYASAPSYLPPWVTSNGDFGMCFKYYGVFLYPHHINIYVLRCP